MLFFHYASSQISIIVLQVWGFEGGMFEFALLLVFAKKKEKQEHGREGQTK